MASEEELGLSQFLSKDSISIISGDENINTQNTTYFELKTFDGHKVNMPVLALDKLKSEAKSETVAASFRSMT